MWPAWVLLRTYGPYITFPIALIAGFIGYNVEQRIRKERRELEYLEKSVEQQRLERQLKEAEERRKLVLTEKGEIAVSTPMVEVDSLKEKKYVPKSSLERNPVGTKSGGFFS